MLIYLSRFMEELQKPSKTVFIIGAKRENYTNYLEKIRSEYGKFYDVINVPHTRNKNKNNATNTIINTEEIVKNGLKKISETATIKKIICCFHGDYKNYQFFVGFARRLDESNSEGYYRGNEFIEMIHSAVKPQMLVEVFMYSCYGNKLIEQIKDVKMPNFRIYAIALDVEAAVTPKAIDKFLGNKYIKKDDFAVICPKMVCLQNNEIVTFNTNPEIYKHIIEKDFVMSYLCYFYNLLTPHRDSKKTDKETMKNIIATYDNAILNQKNYPEENILKTMTSNTNLSISLCNEQLDALIVSLKNEYEKKIADKLPENDLNEARERARTILSIAFYNNKDGYLEAAKHFESHVKLAECDKCKVQMNKCACVQ